jgi:hypothetical protein
MALQKPQRVEDLLPPFDRIGEPGWSARLREWLGELEFPLEEPSSPESVVAAEARLGVPLEPGWRTFLLQFGPLSFDYTSLSRPEEIVRMDGVWFRDFLSDAQREDLWRLLQVGDTGSDNFIVYDTRERSFFECSHDPAGFLDYYPDFDALLRVCLIRLWAGYDGWDDVDVLVESAVESLQAVWWEEHQAASRTQLAFDFER